MVFDERPNQQLEVQPNFQPQELLTPAPTEQGNPISFSRLQELMQQRQKLLLLQQQIELLKDIQPGITFDTAQCDQMARSFFNIWPITTLISCPKT